MEDVLPTEVQPTENAPKPAVSGTANGNGKKPKSKSSKPSVKKVATKKKPAKKRAKPSKSVAKKAKPTGKRTTKPKHAKKSKGGRPLMYPDHTMLRMPAGYLKAVNVKARAKDLSQGEYLRGVIGRAIGK